MFVVEYDSKIETFSGNGDVTEHVVDFYTKFEDALAGYREVTERTPLFAKVLNIKISRAILEEVDVTQFL